MDDFKFAKISPILLLQGGSDRYKGNLIFFFFLLCVYTSLPSIKYIILSQIFGDIITNIDLEANLKKGKLMDIVWQHEQDHTRDRLAVDPTGLVGAQAKWYIARNNKNLQKYWYNKYFLRWTKYVNVTRNVNVKLMLYKKKKCATSATYNDGDR